MLMQLMSSTAAAYWETVTLVSFVKRSAQREQVRDVLEILINT